MELLQSVRAISRRRLSVTAGVLFALAGVLFALATLVALGGTNPVTTPTAVAWTSVALDTPQSQLVAVAPLGAETLAWRASLLTHLMSIETSTREVARRLGVRADQVAVVDPALATPQVSTAMAQAAATAASRNVAPYALTVFVQNQSLPVISIEAAAPNRAGAERLAAAALAVLEYQASPGGRFTSPIPTGAKVFERQPYSIGQVAPVRVKLLSATALPMTAIGASILIFVAWCGGVALLRRLSRALGPRRAVLPA